MTKSPAKNANPQRASDKASQLLELHLQHELARFRGKNLTAWLKVQADALWQWADTVTLREAVRPEQVKATIRKNVQEDDISPAVAEIAGEAASFVAAAPLQADTPFRDIISRRSCEEMIDKLIELRATRSQTINQILELPVYRDMIASVLYQAIVRYLYDNNMLSRNVPGVSSMLKMSRDFINKRAPGLETMVEENVRSYISRNMGFLVKESQRFLSDNLTDEQLRQSALDLWDQIEDHPVGDLLQGMDEMDLSELISLGYDFWLSFRKTGYFEESYCLVVDYIYSKYGDTSLAATMQEFYLTADKILIECERFLPDLVKAMDDAGVLETLLRQHLESFYFSEAALKALGEN